MFYLKLVLIYFSAGLCTSYNVKKEPQCAPGSYLLTPRTGPDICRWCTDGVNFVPRYSEFWHSNRTCFNCTQVRDENLEILVSPCNKTDDAEILCRDGFYRRRARNVREIDTCVRCSVCEHIALPCQGYDDHVCCLSSYEVIKNKHGLYECKERPIVCGAGEFLNLKTEQCTPCPPGTFMTSDKHNHTNCQLCQTLDDVALNHETLQSCNRTHPAIFGCKDGYFNFVSETLNETINLCEPCMKCGDQQHEVRKCDRFHDTVCCDLAEMMIEDTDQGPRCLSVYLSDNFNNTRATVPGTVKEDEITRKSIGVVPECGAGEYPGTNTTTNQTTCLPYLSSPCEKTTSQPSDTQPDTACLTGDPENSNSTQYITGLILGLLVIAFITLCLVCYGKSVYTWVIKNIRAKTQKYKSNSPLVCFGGVYSVIDDEETDTSANWLYL